MYFYVFCVFELLWGFFVFKFVDDGDGVLGEFGVDIIFRVIEMDVIMIGL